ncbi:hypothetical protein THF1D04_10714 [Vibrio owensii]|uniref:Uncharacterized protein n=1 Tax=Vibrio owensii TaxID=696485 RepID=A0AAU9PZK7_9VIBR|nr:hypothetical protein THF1D04_10714 [Vibrio owensii]
MLMKLTEQQIREARIDLAAVGFRAAITNLVRNGMHEGEVIPYLSRETKKHRRGVYSGKDWRCA